MAGFRRALAQRVHGEIRGHVQSVPEVGPLALLEEYVPYVWIGLALTSPPRSEDRTVEPIIRTETPADIDAITEVTAAAFAGLAISQHTEQYVILALREAGVLAVSLVAEVDGRVVGHVAFSPVSISDGTSGWYGLGPVSVLPEHQRCGIGRALIARGLALVRERGGQGCTLVGDPGYYVRFGFRNVPGLVHEGVPPEVFLVLPFTDAVPQGTVVFHDGFRAREPPTLERVPRCRSTTSRCAATSTACERRATCA